MAEVGERPRFARGRPLTPREIDELIAETLDDIEAATEDLAGLLVEHAKAEVAYRSEHAKLLSTSSAKTEAAKAAHALYGARKLLETRKDLEARVDGAKQLCRSRADQLEGLRSLSASARVAETGRG